MTGLDKINTAWKDIKIKIAVTGKSGSGKSTLINALLNLKDDDEGAAKTGCVETTSEPTPYPHPNNRNLELWDLPGVGTPNFPQSTYLKQTNPEARDKWLHIVGRRVGNKSCTVEVRIRITMSTEAIARLSRLWTSSSSSFATKPRLLKSLVVINLLCGCET
ncbi:interferon-inducible GTPase 5-like [Dreissena polymorpha]|uniref:interferon-inducible GTPase 5-like n=1 Tax=Dreissena polymorpha TaxID=45954 RepID=UPI00226452D1|nr:interferon-inducible GTPase 5-like [Dreissena polymorpha]